MMPFSKLKITRPVNLRIILVSACAVFLSFATSHGAPQSLPSAALAGPTFPDLANPFMGATRTTGSAKENLAFTRDGTGLTVMLPEKGPCDHAWALSATLSDYRRELDIDRAVHRVSYEWGPMLL